MSAHTKFMRLSEISQSEWRNFKNHENIFFSASGKAAKKVTKKGVEFFIELRGTSCGLGYKAVTLEVKEGKHKRVYIHRAICQLFNGLPPEGKNIVRHLDCNMYNNAASNLAWGDVMDNAQDGVANGKSAKGTRNPQAKLNEEKVIAMRLERKERKTPYYKIASMFDVSTMTAFRATKGISWAI